MFRILLIVLEVGVAQLLFGQALGKSKGHGAPFSGEGIDDDAKTFGTAWNFVKDHRRPVIRRNDDIGRQADLLLP